MSPSERDAAHGRASVLLRQWRDASASSVWRGAGDWHTPAVDSIVDAIIADAGLEDAAAQLGAHRAERGIGLAEGLQDLALPFAIARDSEPPFVVSRSFAEQWSEVTTGALLGRGAIDALTGLATYDYLAVRLSEIFAEAIATRVRPEREWSLVVVRGSETEGWPRVVHRSVIARVMSSVLDQGQTNAALESGSFVSITRAASAAEHTMRLRHRLADVAHVGEIRVERMPLATSLAATLDLVETL